MEKRDREKSRRLMENGTFAFFSYIHFVSLRISEIFFQFKQSHELFTIQTIESGSSDFNIIIFFLQWTSLLRNFEALICMNMINTQIAFKRVRDGVTSSQNIFPRTSSRTRTEQTFSDNGNGPLYLHSDVVLYYVSMFWAVSFGFIWFLHGCRREERRSVPVACGA